MNNFIYRTKNDYLKLGSRSNVHTTILSKTYKKWQKLSIDIDQPTSKMFDIALDLIMENEDLKQQLIDRVQNYR